MTTRSLFSLAGTLLLAVACAAGRDPAPTDARSGADMRTFEILELQRSGGPEDDRCAQLTADQCGATTSCRLMSGRRLDRARRCWLPAEPAGCRQADIYCGLAITPARDDAGNCWLFSSTCIPIGWNRVYGNRDAACGIDTPPC